MDDRDVIKVLVELWKEERASPLEYVVWYGSRANDADLDLLILCSAPIHWQNSAYGRLDVLCMTWTEFTERVGLLDPIAIDPLMEGQIISGDAQRWEALKTRRSDTPPEATAISYLLSRSSEQCVSSLSLLDTYRQTSQSVHLLWSLVNLGYVFSYWLLAGLYKHSEWKGPVTVHELLQLDASQDFADLWAAIRRAKRKPEALAEAEVVSFYQRWEDVSLQQPHLG